MLLKLLLFMTYFCVTNAYFLNHTIRCPGDTVERNYRGKARCRSIQEYHCLYDDFFNMAEICQSYRQLPKGSYPRYSSFGDNIYYDPCLEGTFQVGPPKSYQLTECLFQKSKCVSEGQILCNGGTPSTDATCRCDYKNGYKPVEDKCCSPTSLDDCSCYKNVTKCSENEEYDRDYNCIPKCPSGFQKKEGSSLCTEIPNLPVNTPSTALRIHLLKEKEISREYSYFTFRIILGVAASLYLLYFIFMLVYAIMQDNIYPLKYKIVPFVGISVGILICFGISIFVKEVSCAHILTVCVIILSAWIVLVTYIIFTHELAKERDVYDEEYDKRIFQLLQAASDGDIKMLETLRNEDYVDMDDTDYDNRSALHLAAVSGQVEAVTYLLKHHLCYPDAVDRWNRSAKDDMQFHKENKKISATMQENYTTIESKLRRYLETKKRKPPKRHFRETKAVEIITAAEKGDLNSLKRLKKLGTDMNLSNSIGRTALHAAAEKERKDVVKFLLKSRVSPFVRWRDKRPIDVLPDHDGECTIRQKLHDEMEKILKEDLTEKFDELPDQNLQTVRLLNAAARGDIRLIRSYHASGYNMNAADYDQRTALHVAVSENQEHVVDFLLRFMEEKKDTKDRWNNTPSYDSTNFGKEIVHQVFLVHYPELIDTENDQYRTYLLLSAGARGDVEVLKTLLDKKVDMELRNYDGRTALHLAVAENKLEAVKFLLTNGKVKTNIPDRENRKPIDYVKNNDEIKTLLKHAEMEEKHRPVKAQKLTNNEETLLLVLKAAAKGHLHTLKTNQFLHFPMDNCDYFKETPLHVAAAKGRLEDVQYLLSERKVSPFVKNSFWKMPIDLVKEKKTYWGNKEKVASNFVIQELSNKVSSETDITKTMKEKRRQDFVDIENILIESMKLSDNGVEEDANFKKHNEDERIFLFLNKAYKGDIKAVRRYLKTDYSMLNKTDYDKRTALHLAAAEGHIDLVKYLLSQPGCKKDVEDRWECTPLNEAMKTGNYDMMELLDD